MSQRVALFGLVAVLAAAGCASEDWHAKYEDQQKQNLELSAQMDEAKQQRAEQAAKSEQYAQQLKSSDIEAQKTRQAYEAAMQQNEELRKQGVAPKSASAPVVDSKALEALAQQIRSEGGKSIDGVTVTKDGNIEITLSSDVTFAPGAAELTESGKKSLRNLAPVLKGKFAPYQVRVEGHTDSTPLVRTKAKYQDNFGLGSARSLAVVRFMETDLGLEPTRLMSASRGEHEPVADNKSDGGKKQNRRVEIVVVMPHDAAMSMAK